MSRYSIQTTLDNRSGDKLDYAVLDDGMVIIARFKYMQDARAYVDAPPSNPTEVTAATVANMRRYEAAHPLRMVDTANGPVKVHPPRCFAYSPGTGEEFSGDAGDYYAATDEDQPLIDAEGDPMLLVTSRALFLDALTGMAV